MLSHLFKNKFLKGFMTSYLKCRFLNVLTHTNFKQYFYIFEELSYYLSFTVYYWIRFWIPILIYIHVFIFHFNVFLYCMNVLFLIQIIKNFIFTFLFDVYLAHCLPFACLILTLHINLFAPFLFHVLFDFLLVFLVCHFSFLLFSLTHLWFLNYTLNNRSECKLHFSIFKNIFTFIYYF